MGQPKVNTKILYGKAEQMTKVNVWNTRNPSIYLSPLRTSRTQLLNLLGNSYRGHQLGIDGYQFHKLTFPVCDSRCRAFDQAQFVIFASISFLHRGGFRYCRAAPQNASYQRGGMDTRRNIKDQGGLRLKGVISRHPNSRLQLRK